MEKINVTKTFLPPIEEYQTYLEEIWSRGQVTNQGPLVLEFERRVEQYLKVKNLHFVSNGTIALQIALRSLGITEGEVITTAFSYVATVSAILWERCTPVFVDIEPGTFCIDADKIEAAITDHTKAIMAVHVFGYPCDIEKIEAIARKHNLQVIYDGAHAFGVTYNEASVLSYGDISMCSFHATKLFHTVEGGCIIIKDKTISKRAELIKRFGHNGDKHFTLGINGKVSELHAAMGLCNLKYVDNIIKKRAELSDVYNRLLENKFRRPEPKATNFKYNYAYYPIIFDSEQQLTQAVARLNQVNIFPRRYFYPSLNTLPYLEIKQSCPISEDIALRILCLPLYIGLEPAAIEKICGVLKK